MPAQTSLERASAEFELKWSRQVDEDLRKRLDEHRDALDKRFRQLFDEGHGTSVAESIKRLLTDYEKRVGDEIVKSQNGIRRELAELIRGLDAVERAFGRDVDFAQLVKFYGTEPGEERKFSPPVVLSEEVRIIQGQPDPEKISTSGVERQNLTMRMGMRRFTRLTNGFSKKAENHAAAISLHYMYVNFARPHKSLANPYPRTPAMAAGIEDHIWSCEEIAALLD